MPDPEPRKGRTRRSFRTEVGAKERGFGSTRTISLGLQMMVAHGVPGFVDRRRTSRPSHLGLSGPCPVFRQKTQTGTKDGISSHLMRTKRLDHSCPMSTISSDDKSNEGKGPEPRNPDIYVRVGTIFTFSLHFFRVIHALNTSYVRRSGVFSEKP